MSQLAVWLIHMRDPSRASHLHEEDRARLSDYCEPFRVRVDAAARLAQYKELCMSLGHLPRDVGEEDCSACGVSNQEAAMARWRHRLLVGDSSPVQQNLRDLESLHDLRSFAEIDFEDKFQRYCSKASALGHIPHCAGFHAEAGEDLCLDKEETWCCVWRHTLRLQGSQERQERVARFEEEHSLPPFASVAQFDQRCQELEHFIHDKARRPREGVGYSQTERALARWVRNALCRCLPVQRNRITAILALIPLKHRDLVKAQSDADARWASEPDAGHGLVVVGGNDNDGVIDQPLSLIHI